MAIQCIQAWVHLHSMERAHDLEVYLFELLSLDVDSRLSSSQRNLQSFKDRWYPCCIWLLGCYVHGFAKSAIHLVCWGVLLPLRARMGFYIGYAACASQRAVRQQLRASNLHSSDKRQQCKLAFRQQLQAKPNTRQQCKLAFRQQLQAKSASSRHRTAMQADAHHRCTCRLQAGLQPLCGASRLPSVLS